jgi:hypothetical protein
VITPLPFSLSAARADPKLKRHTAKRLTEIPILFLVIKSFLHSRAFSASSLEICRCPGRDVIEGGQEHRTGKSDRRNNIPDEAEVR